MTGWPGGDPYAEIARQKTKFAVLTALAASLGGVLAALLIAVE